MTAGSFGGLDTSGIVDGDAFDAGATVNGTGPTTSTFGYAQDPNTRVNYLATALIQNTEVDFVATVGSGAKATGPLTGLPFRWGDGPALVRAYRTTLLGSASSRQASGSVRLAGEVRLYEFHDDGDAGFKISDGRALHNVRKSERRVLGWFYLSGGKATFVGALLAGKTYFSGLAAMVDGNRARWVQASGRWFASDETRVQDSGMSVRVLTAKGLIASDGASVVYADASQAVTRSPPSVVALNANMSRAYSIPALDAVVVPVDTQYTNYGLVYVTFDAGATWKGPVKTMTSSGGSSPQLNVVVNPKLVPLYPTAS